MISTRLRSRWLAEDVELSAAGGSDASRSGGAWDKGLGLESSRESEYDALDAGRILGEGVRKRDGGASLAQQRSGVHSGGIRSRRSGAGAPGYLGLKSLESLNAADADIILWVGVNGSELVERNLDGLLSGDVLHVCLSTHAGSVAMGSSRVFPRASKLEVSGLYRTAGGLQRSVGARSVPAGCKTSNDIMSGVVELGHHVESPLAGSREGLRSGVAGTGMDEQGRSTEGFGEGSHWGGLVSPSVVDYYTDGSVSTQGSARMSALSGMQLEDQEIC